MQPILGKWISKEELRSGTRSRKDGIGYREEKNARKVGIVFLTDLGIKLDITQIVISTASTYFHVFFTRQSLKQFDVMEMACVCIFLAAKYENKRKKCEHVMDAYYDQRRIRDGSFITPKKDSNEYNLFRDKIYKLEWILLDTLEYNFGVDHPYKYLIDCIKRMYGKEYANKSDEWQQRYIRGDGKLAQHAYFFVNDSFRSTVCLQFPPQQIAVGVIYLSLNTAGLKTVLKENDTRENPPSWHEELFGCSKELLEQKICKQIMAALSSNLRNTHGGNLLKVEERLGSKHAQHKSKHAHHHQHHKSSSSSSSSQYAHERGNSSNRTIEEGEVIMKRQSSTGYSSHHNNSNNHKRKQIHSSNDMNHPYEKKIKVSNSNTNSMTPPPMMKMNTASSPDPFDSPDPFAPDTPPQPIRNHNNNNTITITTTTNNTTINNRITAKDAPSPLEKATPPQLVLGSSPVLMKTLESTPPLPFEQ